jgi:protein-disulfide isomerase
MNKPYPPLSSSCIRRLFILQAVCALTPGARAGTKVLVDNSPQDQKFKPYLQVSPVASEENTVRVFFSPNCPYSYNYFNFFTNLSKTLPSELRFELTPLPNKRDSAQYALAFLAIRRYLPRFINEFTKSSFQLIQEDGLSSKSWSTIEKISKQSKIELSLPQLVLKQKSTLTQDLIDLIELSKKLEVTNTPSVAVAGTYTVTPEFVTGADPNLFNQLVNGVISMALGA